MVLPLPTSPYMYNPRGRFRGRTVAGLVEGLRWKRELRNDLFVGRRDSRDGRTTCGGWYSASISWRS